MVSSMEEIEAYLDKYQNARLTLDHEFDGVVIKLEDRRVQAQMGYTARVPRWAVAFKFRPPRFRRGCSTSACKWVERGA